ncbi:MAG: hypothetical protein J0G94_17815 [Sphingomonadales bacterium]|nr:hypothetical protein [Sphingomonadales bacterium]
MNLTKTIVTAALALGTLGGLPALTAPAQAQGYRYDRGDYRDYRRDDDRRDYRRDHRRSWDRDRDGIPNRYDRYDNRRNWGWNGGYRYRDARRCWTETRWDSWRHQRVRVRICR